MTEALQERPAGREIQLDYIPLPSKEGVHSCTAPNMLLLGGFGDGKTSCGINDLVDISFQCPGIRILLARFTYREIDDTIKETFQQWVPSELYRPKASINEYWMTNGSKFIFRSLDSPDKYGGLEIGAWLIDEAKEVPERVFTVLLGRRRQRDIPQRFRRGILCSNPPTKRHYLYDWFGPDRKNKEKFVTFHGSTYENRDNLPPGYIEDLEDAYKHSPTLFKRYVLGEWGADVSGKPVHPGFREEVHVDQLRDSEHPYIYNKSRRIIRGWDFGKATGGCVFWQVDDRGRCRILLEIPTLNMGNAVDGFIRLVKARSAQLFPQAVFKDWGDPTGRTPDITTGTSVFQIARHNHDLLILAPPKTNREWRAEQVDIWLNQMVDGIPLITLAGRHRTPILEDGFAGEYCFGKDRDGGMKDVISEDCDAIHLMDGFQYSWIGEMGLYPNLRLRRGKPPPPSKDTAMGSDDWNEDDEPFEQDNYLGMG